MIIDNWKILRDKLDFTDKNKFYFIQLQQRKKDDESFPANNRTVKSYFISSLKEYDALESEIKRLSDETKSRVYIRLNRRSFIDVTIEILKSITKMMEDNNYSHLKNLVPSAAGTICSEKDKTWIIDIDADNPIDLAVKAPKVINYLYENFGNVYKFSVPTLHGVHLITNKFDSKKFSEDFPDIDIHKDNPTLLYFKNE